MTDADLPTETCDVLVVGAGIAGLSTALAAHERGARVILLEKAPKAERGGNTRFSDAQICFPHKADVYCRKDYTEAQFRNDLMRLSRDRANPELVDVLVTRAADTVAWLTDLGVAWELGFPFSAGYRRRPVEGGEGLVETLFEAVHERGLQVYYETAVRQVLTNSKGCVCGVQALAPNGFVAFRSQATVLATGGFQANVEMRTRYLGRRADALILRGSRYDTGEGLMMALDLGAQPAGQWGDYHSAVLDARSPKVECGVTAIYIYQLGILVNRAGKRFLDEGADYRDHTYVIYSKAIIEEAEGLAYCLFDAQATELPEFQRGIRAVGEPVRADSIRELAERLGIPPDALAETVETFNAAVQPGTFNPDLLDGKATRDITPAKSNWALPINTPPFIAYPVTGGITFTFGGLKVNANAQVIDTSDRVIPGLYTAGEPIGELYYTNYPGATSVLRGAVFGRIAGYHAAGAALGKS